ncbi:hypothetical protein HDE_06163 [Halotydeus destructor]|nr:hypothetical protein HDE_06163 [Halotydeus destructor]
METSTLILLFVLIGLCSAGFRKIEDTEASHVAEAQECARKYASNLSDSEYEPKITKLISAMWDPGCMDEYKFEFELKDTFCRKGSDEAKNLDSCEENPEALTLVCEVEVQQYTHDPEGVSAKCQPKLE